MTSIGNRNAPACRLQSTLTCCDMRAASPWRTQGMTLGLCRDGWAIAISSIRFDTPSWLRTGSRISGGTARRPLDGVQNGRACSRPVSPAADPARFVMCGRLTVKMTWEELVRLYHLTVDQPARNTQARCNVGPTDPIRHGGRARRQARGGRYLTLPRFPGARTVG